MEQVLFEILGNEKLIWDLEYLTILDKKDFD
jgi:hypothetical protein